MSYDWSGARRERRRKRDERQNEKQRVVEGRGGSVKGNGDGTKAFPNLPPPFLDWKQACHSSPGPQGWDESLVLVHRVCYLCLCFAIFFLAIFPPFAVVRINVVRERERSFSCYFVLIFPVLSRFFFPFRVTLHVP